MSDENLADRLYFESVDSARRYDFFVAGAGLAMLGYLASNYSASQLGLNAGTVELLGILVLFGAVYCGMKRIEATNVVLRSTHRSHRYAEPAYDEEARVWGRKSKRWYDWRNRLLLAGVLMIVAGRILGAYTSSPEVL